MFPLFFIFLLIGACKADCDVQEYFQGLDPTNPQIWALQMLDSSSKTPSDGVLDGSFAVQLGNYDECLSIRGPPDSTGAPRFKGQYCLYQLGFTGPSLGFLNNTISQQQKLNHALQMAIGGPRYQKPTKTNFAWGVCAPSTCSPQSVKKIADFNLQLVAEFLRDEANTTVLAKSCYYEGDGSKTLDAGSWSFIAFLGVLVAWICFSTGFHHFHPDIENSGWRILIHAFSLKNTWRDLSHMPTTIAPGQLSCLHGLRVGSIFWVILGHTYMFQNTMPLVNYLSGNYRAMKQWFVAPVLNGFLAVDTFFLLSGLLTTYVPMMDFKKGRKFNILKYYVYRYVRITAPLAIVVWYLATLNEKISHSPLWFYNPSAQKEICQEYWWAQLLYITNYVYPSCLGQAWYLCVDMQLALLAPFLIMPLMKWPKFTLMAKVLLTLGSMAACFGITYVRELPWTLSFRPDVDGTEYLTIFYQNTPLRAVPYLVGMIMGYVLIEKIRVPLNKGGVVLGWLLSAALCLSVLFTILIPYELHHKYDKLEASFYAAFHKLGWSLGLAWVIWACVNGHGGFVNRILSWKYFLPLSKLTFSAYLVHQDWLIVQGGLRRSAIYLSHLENFYVYFGHWFFIFPLSVFMYLAIEAPLMIVLRAVFKKKVATTSEARKSHIGKSS